MCLSSYILVRLWGLTYPGERLSIATNLSFSGVSMTPALRPLRRALIASVLLTASLIAQDPRGAITGRVLDPSGSSIPKARVRAINDATRVAAGTLANDSANFAIPFLNPGSYTVTAEAPGFKTFSRSGIQVRIGDTVALDIALEIGTATEIVDVRSEAPPLDTASSSLGQVVDSRRLMELPLNAGNPMELLYLTPGMVNTSGTIPPSYAPWTGASVESNGNSANSNDYSIDGVPNTYPNGISRGVRPALNPPTTAVSEFRVQTTSYDASVGNSMGASVNVSTKGGTNRFSGGAHWFLKNSALDTPSFFENRAGRALEPYQYNRGGFDIGGPVLLPRYNGRNKTFFFYTYERNIWEVPEPRTDTVPTARQKQGDFSQLLSLGTRYQIYDPFSATPAAGGRLTRSPYAGNIIPAIQFDPVGRRLVNVYPEPNLPGNADGASNFYTPAVATQDYWVHLIRVDHALRENHRFFVRLDIARWDEDQLRRLGRANPASGLLTKSRDKGGALDYVGVLSPTTVFNFRYGLTYQLRSDYRASQGIDLTELGFSPTLASLVDRKFATIPEIQPDGYARISRFFGGGDGANTGLTHSFNANFTRTQQAHNLKLGASFRAYRSFGNRFPYATSPFFRITSAFTRGPLDNAAAAPLGQDMAALLLGLPTEASFMQLTPSFALNGPSLGLFIQDDYKLSRKLTLNLGLRWEYDLPVTERFNRLVSQFDATSSNPIEAAARANYAANPVPEVSPANFNVRGGLTWVSSGNRTPFQSQKMNFMPRIGLAYQLTPTTVIRAGYGMFFDTVGVNQTVPIQTGFSQSTPIQVTRDGGQTFVARMSNPLPGGLLQPRGPAGGLKTNLSQSLNFFNQVRKTPYSQRWSYGFQHLLPAQFLIDISYVGNRGTRLEVPRNINGIPNQYLSTSFLRDQATIDRLSARLASPFFGTDPIYGSTATRGELLRPFPQFGSIVVDDNTGYSWYHSLQVSAERRFSHGVTFQLNYTRSKLMQATEYLNAADAATYETLAVSDRPNILSLSAVWELPVGKGRKFFSGMPGVLDGIAGGWQVALVGRHQSGSPLEFGDAVFIGDIKNIALSSGERSVDRWFNTAAGFDRDSSRQRASNVRSFPLRFGHVRSDAQRRWDASLKKEFHIVETLKLEFRADAINATNTPIFTGPNTSPVSSGFGQVTAVAWPGRQWQFALRLRF